MAPAFFIVIPQRAKRDKESQTGLFAALSLLRSLDYARDDIMGFVGFSKNEVRYCAGRTIGVIRLADRPVVPRRRIRLLGMTLLRKWGQRVNLFTEARPY